MNGRIIGVDVGEKRMGLAVSDPTGFLASPLRMVEVAGPRQAAAAVAAAAREQGAVRIVVGHPRNMDGSLGPAAQKAEEFAGRVREASGLPVDLWDERLTTKSALDALRETGASRGRRRELVDQMAAQIMLQNYLDAKGGG